MPSRAEAERFLSEEVLYGGEVAQMLGVPPQAINNLVYRGKLIPIRSGPGANLFLRDDIEAYRLGRRHTPILSPVDIVGRGVTRRCLEHLKTFEQDKLDDIISIAFYEFSYDAAVDRYVSPLRDCYSNEQKLVATTTPQCVITFSDGSELWLKGLNTGYGGEGPHGSYEVLTDMLHVPEHIAEAIFYASVAKFTRLDRKHWVLAEALTPDKDMICHPNLSYYYYHGNFVVAVTLDEHSAEVDWPVYMPYVLPFLEDPSHIEILSREDATATGRVERSWPGRTNVFQVSIHDRSGAQVWVNLYVPDNAKIYNQINIITLFEELGMPLPEKTKDTFSSRLGRLMQKTLFVNRRDSAGGK